jgi:hypothetical protein
MADINKEFTDTVQNLLNNDWVIAVENPLESVAGINYPAVLLKRQSEFRVVLYRSRAEFAPDGNGIVCLYDIFVGTPEKSFKGEPGELCNVDRLNLMGMWTYRRNGDDYTLVSVSGRL